MSLLKKFLTTEKILLASVNIKILFTFFFKWLKLLCFYTEHIFVFEFSAKEVERGTWIED